MLRHLWVFVAMFLIWVRETVLAAEGVGDGSPYQPFVPLCVLCAVAEPNSRPALLRRCG